MSYNNEALYLEHGEKCYAMRRAVEDVADTVCKKGFSSIFFVGAGGSLMMLDSFRYMFQQLSEIPVYSLESAEVKTSSFHQLKKGALVVLVTLNGTKETDWVAEYCKQNEIDIVAFVGTQKCPVAETATHTIYSNESVSALRYMQLYFFVFRILYNLGCFDEYERFGDELKNLPAALFQAAKDFQEISIKIAEQCSKEDFILWVSSGVAYSETFRFASCCVEEVFRKKTQTMNSAEFFHGCFEIVDKDLCVVLVKNEDDNRALEDRVERFLKRYGEKYFVVDTTITPLKGINPEFRKYMLPAVLNVVFRSHMQDTMQELTGRSQKTRRYYAVVSY